MKEWKIDLWPKSSDPGLNFVVAVFIISMLGMAIVIGFVFVLPIATIFAGFWFYQKYKKRQEYTTTPLIIQQTQEKVLSAQFPTSEQFIKTHSERFLRVMRDRPLVWSLYAHLSLAASHLYDAENFRQPFDFNPPSGAIEEGRYRDKLLAFQEKIADPEKTLALFRETVENATVEFMDTLPALARTTLQTFALKDDTQGNTLPLLDVLNDPAESVRALIAPFLTEEISTSGLFAALRDQVWANFDAISSKEIVKPKDFKGTKEEMVQAYLQGTPFHRLFLTPLPFEVDLSKQLEHTMIVAGTRWGKSQLIGYIVAEHLEAADPPGMILLDSTGDLLQKIQRLEVFHPETGELRDRLLIIDPEDEHTPSLNMFDTSVLKSKNYSAQDLEQVEADIVDLFNYVFGALGSELTGQQDSAFSFICRLLLSIDGATIFTLKDILEDPADDYNKSKFKKEIEKLSTVSGGDVAIDYFKNQFYTRTVKTTRTAIARRLYQLMRTNVFNRMFSGTNKVDFFEEMNKGSIIVINTSKAVLKPAASALFGRYMIARVLSGAFERVVIKDMNKRKPCILFIDEAQEYFDSSLDTLLTQIGKFKLGVCIAFQYVDQLDQKLRSSVFGNTTVKYAGGLNTNDVRLLAREMRIPESELLALNKDSAKTPEWTEFACFIRNETPRAVKLTVPFYTLEDLPKMEDPAFKVLLARNAQRVSGKTPEPIQVLPDTPDESTPVQTAPTTPAPGRPPRPKVHTAPAPDPVDGSDDY